VEPRKEEEMIQKLICTKILISADGRNPPVERDAHCIEFDIAATVSKF
jgi:hypothetical protein